MVKRKEKHKKPEKIDEYKAEWAHEFANLAGIEYHPEYEKIISLAMVTALYRVADIFADSNPDIRKQILTHFGV